MPSGILTAVVSYNNSMISFVWSSQYPLLAGTGGSETYTVGHVKELRKRGIAARILTLGLGKHDGRKQHPHVPFDSVTLDQLAKLDDTIVFVNELVKVQTKKPAFVIFHCPPPALHVRDVYRKWVADKTVIVTSNFAAKLWGKWFDDDNISVHVVYPFAEHEFDEVISGPYRNARPTVLYAGRLAPEKGIYTLLAAIHYYGLNGFDFSVTDAGAHTPAGKLLKPLIKAHPRIQLIKACTTRKDMAELIADHDIVVMPTGGCGWQETFGMLSVEAQHAGRRVVAMNDGGLPETNCGGLTLVQPNNAYRLAKAIADTYAMGPLKESERAEAITHFTVEESVDNLLCVLNLQ